MTSSPAPAAQATTRAFVKILEHAGINYAVLGKGEKCTGDPARRAGNEYLYYQLATENVEVLNETLIAENLDPAKKKRVVTTCPHCFNALFNDYPQLGGHYDVLHHTQRRRRTAAVQTHQEKNVILFLLPAPSFSYSKS